MLYPPVISKHSYPVESAPIWIMSMIQFRHPDMKLIGISHLETALSCGDQLQIASSMLKSRTGRGFPMSAVFFMTGWNPNALESSPCPRTKNLDAERRNEERVFFGERRTAQRSTSFFCSYEPATPDLRPRPFLQLTTCILELATVLFGERRTVQR